MPVSPELNFTLSDAKGVFLALCLISVLFLPGGYLIGAYLAPQNFNQKKPIEKLLHAAMLVFAILPILLFLLFRIHFLLALLFCCASFIAFILRKPWAQVTSDEQSKEDARFIFFAIFVWVAIALFTICDWQWGENLYMSVVVWDYEKHVAVVDCISRTGVPPVNPTYYPGTPISLYYYYFWFLFPALIDKVSMGAVGPYCATIAATIFTGLGFLGLIINLSEKLFPDKKLYPIALVLLLVSGLDILIVAPVNILSKIYFGTQPFASVEWWTMDQVSSFTHFLCWVPHHVTGCIAVLTAILLARDGLESEIKKDKIKYFGIAALALASSVGSSVYLAFVGTAGLCLYVLLSIIAKNMPAKRILELFALLSTSGILASFFLLGLHSQINSSPIVLGVRSSGLLRYFLDPKGAGINSGVKDQLGLIQPSVQNWGESLLLLLIDYPIEFGFFFLAAALFWYKKHIEKEDLLPISIFIASLTICTFLRSAIHNNDLGWRGLIPAQIILLLWSSVYLKNRLDDFKGVHFLKHPVIILLVLLALTGAGTTFYDIYLLRFTQLDSKREALENNPEKNYFIRKAYEELRRNKNISIVQANPIHDRDPFFGLYSQHQTLASDKEYGPLFGIDIEKYNELVTKLEPVFSGKYTLDEVKSLAQKYSLDAIFVKQDDPVFSNKDSWATQLKPDIENKYARVFLIRQKN